MRKSPWLCAVRKDENVGAGAGNKPSFAGKRAADFAERDVDGRATPGLSGRCKSATEFEKLVAYAESGGADPGWFASKVVKIEFLRGGVGAEEGECMLDGEPKGCSVDWHVVSILRS
jgi:hypothetical protein